MEYTKVSKAKYTANPNGIECVVDFVGLGEVPFTAVKDDLVDHGKQIYAELVAGKWGKVGAYSEDPTLVRELFKNDRALRVQSIVVEYNGNKFDGDEVSQNRMSRAVVGLGHQPDGTTLPWVLSDNTVVEVTKEDLAAVLILAGQKQTDLWVMEV